MLHSHYLTILAFQATQNRLWGILWQLCLKIVWLAFVIVLCMWTLTEYLKWFSILFWKLMPAPVVLSLYFPHEMWYPHLCKWSPVDLWSPNCTASQGHFLAFPSTDSQLWGSVYTGTGWRSHSNAVLWFRDESLPKFGPETKPKTQRFCAVHSTAASEIFEPAP